MQTLQTLKSKVEYCLNYFPETRNSDISLTIKIWEEFYPTLLNNGMVNIKNLFELPREDNVKRIRAKFNSKGKYLPTDIKIIQARGLKENKWREELGYSKTIETYYPTKEESYTEKVIYNGKGKEQMLEGFKKTTNVSLF